MVIIYPGRMKNWIIIIGFSLLACFQAVAQQYFFSGYSVGDGLSQSVVNCIFQDSRGYVWIGTQNGLNKFNGLNFEVFIHNPADSNSIANNWVYGIAEDREANLWIGTKGGLIKYIRKENQFRRIRYTIPYRAGVADCVYDVKCANDGTILINTPPVLSVLHPQTSKFMHYISPLSYDGSVKDNNIPLFEDGKGNIWTGSTRGLAVFEPGTKTFKTFHHRPGDPLSLSDNNITALYQDRKGDLWIGTAGGLNKIAAGDIGFIHSNHDFRSGVSLSNDFIRAIIADKSGNLWIATEGGGLNRLGRNKEGIIVLNERFSADVSGLNHNINLSLLIDNSDNLWIGTLSGLNKTDLKKRNFKLYRKSDSPYSVDLAGNVVASVYKDADNILWIGNWGQGLNLYNRETGEVVHYSSLKTGQYYIPNDFIHCIFEDDLHDIWLGTRDGLLVYDKNLRRFFRPDALKKDGNFPGFQGLRINMMIQDRSKNYWVATNDGLYKMNRGGSFPEHYAAGAKTDHRISANLVYAVLEDKEGDIWIGTINGLDVIDAGKHDIVHFMQEENKSNMLSGRIITGLCEDQKGDIWIGTDSYVNRYSRKGKTFSYYSRAEGFPGNLVYSIVEDKNGQLWFSTGNGLCRFDSVSTRFICYTEEDGLQSPEFNIRAAYISSEGELFFGGMNGLNSFYPDSLGENPHIPVIAITAVYKINKGNKQYFNLEKDSVIELNHNERTFTVEFAALEYSNPAKNAYAYKLEGTDDNWIDIGKRNFVAFTNLPPGEYTMRVKGCNNDGRWNETGVSLSIVIHPPWWESNVAYVAYALFVLFLIFMFIKIRERNLLRERKLLEEKVKIRTQLIERQKSEILNKNSELNELNASKDRFFSIIAHDLRNPFNTIIGLTDILLITLNNMDPLKLQKSLESIKTSSQQAHELLENLLLWARSQTNTFSFRPEPVDLITLAQESIGLVAVQASRKNIAIVTDFQPCRKITGDVNMISTILRNLLTNALKYTHRNGEIVVGSDESEGFCILSVKDNGIGITPDKVKSLFSIDAARKTKGTDQEPGTGLGLILCRELIEKHGGRIEVASELGKGSNFRVYFPLLNPER
jgi:ligand-binding sensor domain-containing protein/signal transduction histidine kinase